MRFRTLAPNRMTPDHWDLWQLFQDSSDVLQSPYFSPEFTQLVSEVRDDVQIGILEQGGGIAGFFPYQRWGRVAKPVGGRLSDFQGVVTRAGVHVAADQLIRGCGLRCWDFDHLLTDQKSFAGYYRTTDGSPYITVTDGFEAYRESCSKTGRSEIKKTLAQERKLGREVGEVRLEFTENSRERLNQMIEWKSQQYRDSTITDIFAFDWTVALMHQLLRCDKANFGGVLSCLYAGDELLAVHMGMRSSKVLHYWFPTYNESYAKYSPGRILLLKIIQEAATRNFQQIDLGRGLAWYKQRVMSGVTEVAEGSVDLRPVARVVRKGWRSFKGWLKTSPLAAPAKVPAKLLYRLRERRDFR